MSLDQVQRFLKWSRLNQEENKALESSLVVVRILNSCHCCFRCCLRFLGCTDFSLYAFEEKELFESFNQINEGGLQDSAEFTCTACLGSIQFADTFVEDLCRQLETEGYKVDSCFLSCTLPVSIFSRDHLLKVHVLRTIEDQDLCRVWQGMDTRDPKDFFKYLFGLKLVEKTKFLLDTDSPFRVNVVIGHEPTAKEHMYLTQLKEPLLNIRTVRQKKRRVTVGDSRSSIVEALKKLDNDEAEQVTAIPPVLVTERAKFESATLVHNSSYVGGRYLKFSREYSQTPWAVKGQKLAENSVSECFADLIKDYHRADDTKFVTAGREDANVRMLGTGRPFYLELVNPRIPRLSDEQYKKIEEEINALPLHKDNVQVRHLGYIKPEYTNIIKDGEETKTKRYRALVWLSEPLTDEIIERTNKVGSKPFTIQQKTPVRVFQRRSAAVRPKEIHTSTLSYLNRDVDPSSPEAHFGVLKLHTQAGTYIKEYVHGDLGRTEPNLASVSGVLAADLLELDVMDVDLVWPPVENANSGELDEYQSNNNNKRVYA